MTITRDIPSSPRRRRWHDLHEDPTFTWPPWRALSVPLGSSEPVHEARVDAGGPNATRRYRWGVPGFRPDADSVLAARSPEAAARALVAALREQGALEEPRRRQLLITLYELATTERPNEGDPTNDADVVAHLGVTVELVRTPPA